MEKKDFISLINQCVEQNRLVEKIEEVIHWDSPLIEFGFMMFDRVIDAYFNEKQIDLIYWWLYEKVDKVITVDGKKVPVQTPEQLYDYLMTINDTDNS